MTEKNGFSDPYVKLSIGGHKFTTNVVRKSLNPIWDAPFDIELDAQSLPDQVTLMFWDKDRWGRDDYLGTVYIPFNTPSLWSDATPKHFDDPQNEASSLLSLHAMWLPLISIPGKFSKVTGEVQVKFGFIDASLAPADKNSQLYCRFIWTKLASGRNKLGLGQRQFQTANYTSMAMADIPIAGSDEDPSMGLSALRLETPSPPPRNLSSSPSSSSALPTTATSDSLHGVVFMEIVSASNLPRTHNVTRTGFDMDPFVVISFGKYIFRTRVIRHNLNPTWRAKLMFRVRYGEESFKIKYSVHDWDKLSGNDYVGMATMDVDTLIKASCGQDADRLPSPAPSTNEDRDVADTYTKDYSLKIAIANNIKPPLGDTLLKVRAKFVSYTSLRRRFWLGLAKAFDPDPRKDLYSKFLIQAMLEGLGSTLSSKTVDSFFAPYSKDPEQDELTFDELFERLERQVKLDDSIPCRLRKKRLRRFWSRKSRAARPIAVESDEKESTEESIDDEVGGEDEEDNELFEHLTRNKIPADSAPPTMDMVEPIESDFDPQVSEDEYVIRIAACPICRDPSLGSKLETDVITHIAVCSGNDGFNLDKLILGNFVTEANAQRKWITKVVKTLGYGRYAIGKNNANIIVQDRTTGVMLEEKMPTFIRLGIRLLYRSPAQKIRVSKILANMSRKQGLKFDDPRSKRSIEPFIRFYNLEAHMSEVLEPVKNFKTFNEFFYRKLKPNARTLASPEDDRVAVSVADCRMTCFQTISDAQQFWIKGRQFTIAKLLGDEVLAKKYVGGSLAIFRLAPQDYHRFHIPVRGIISEPKSIAGEYYTVNPMSIRSHLDVYGENKRTISTIESKEFGTVAYCSIGAMMVGSIILTTQPGVEVERMEEHGYFAFGGSTIVVLFEPDSIQFDEDLLRSSKEQIEMLVRVGMRVGRCNKRQVTNNLVRYNRKDNNNMGTHSRNSNMTAQAHCLKHIIRQPRPERTDLAADEDMGSTSSPAPAALTPHSADTSKILHASTDPNLAAGSTTSANCAASRRDSLVDPIPRTSSPTLSLAPTTTLQQEQVNASNEPKIAIGNQRVRRQRRRRIYSRIDYGMPSSHAQLVAFFVCYISLQLVLMEPEGSFGQWFLILLLQLYAWSVVWSRIQLGRHTISQVLVGAAIGAVYGMVWFAIWSWKVEDMIKHWQWMDRYGVIQVRKMWKQLEMDEAVAIGRVGGRIYLRDDQGFPHNAHFVRF
ncbi:hypothetical protein BGX20_009069 [Mortierella sp. AD010]|nr:hypothetical protein BGX20_009069 [Mortierella sp. AD010]